MPKPPPPPPPPPPAAPPPLLRSASGNRPGESELGRQFRDWCLRTYGDSAKTKTVTRSKYQRIAEVLQGGGGGGSGGSSGGGGGGEKGKFQFWVRSKGFRLGNGTREPPAAKMGPGVVYVPVKTGTCQLEGDKEGQCVIPSTCWAIVQPAQLHRHAI
ncbi:hypothetical protein E2320_009434 [Naja naja]|nr:hypothetical protein E2320_009434 [Naja naja]